MRLLLIISIIITVTIFVTVVHGFSVFHTEYRPICVCVLQHYRVPLQAIVGAAGISLAKTGTAVQYW